MKRIQTFRDIDHDRHNDNNGNNSMHYLNGKFDKYNILIILSLIGYSMCIMLSLIVYPNLVDFHGYGNFKHKEYESKLYWLYCGIYGIFFGLVSVVSEILLLESQPKHIPGQANGIKGFVKEITNAFAILAIGLLWGYDCNWFWYVQAISFAIGLLALIFVIIATHLYN